MREDPGTGTPVLDHDRTGLGIALAIARLSLVNVGSRTLEGTCLKGLGTTELESWEESNFEKNFYPLELCADKNGSQASLVGPDGSNDTADIVSMCVCLIYFCTLK